MVLTAKDLLELRELLSAENADSIEIGPLDRQQLWEVVTELHSLRADHDRRRMQSGFLSTKEYDRRWMQKGPPEKYSPGGPFFRLNRG